MKGVIVGLKSILKPAILRFDKLAIRKDILFVTEKNIIHRPASLQSSAQFPSQGSATALAPNLNRVTLELKIFSIANQRPVLKAFYKKVNLQAQSAQRLPPFLKVEAATLTLDMERFSEMSFEIEPFAAQPKRMAGPRRACYW